MTAINKLHAFFLHCFVQFNQTKFLVYCLSIFFVSFLSYLVLCTLKNSYYDKVPPRLRKYLFLSAEKSDSHAMQIGGIPFAIISVISIGLLFYWFPYLIQEHQRNILYFSIVSWLGNLFYGYLDDFYEIRPIVKLFLQITFISAFSLFAAQLVYPAQAAIGFVVLVFLALAIFNGANLIDGLDTLSYKVSSVIYLAYIVLAAPVVNLATLFIALVCFFIMSGFYFFNREPSKIHLGEVGVSCLGFSYFVLGVLTFLDYKKINPTFSALTKALLPCSILFVEIGVSFLRRLINGKSPLKGDRNHIHHILKNSYAFSASNASSIIAGSYLFFVLASFYFMDSLSSIFSFIFLNGFWTIWSLVIGWKHWSKNNVQLNILNGLFVDKDVRVLPHDSLSDFKIVITKKRKEN